MITLFFETITLLHEKIVKVSLVSFARIAPMRFRNFVHMVRQCFLLAGKIGGKMSVMRRHK